MRAAERSPPPKLPVWRTALDAYRLTLANVGALGTLAWAWLLVLLVVSAGLYWSFWPSEMAAREAGRLGSAALLLATSTTSTLIGAAVAVGWHRFLLLGEAPGAQPSLRLDGRVWRYVATAAAFLLPFMIPLLAIVAIGPGVETAPEGELDVLDLAGIAYLIVIAMFPVITRLTLILPAIAVEPVMPSLGGIWRHTRRNTLRLTASALLNLLPMLVLGAGLALTLSGAEDISSRTVYTLRNTLSDVAAFLAGMVGVTFLTVAYRELFPPLPVPPVSR